MTPDTVLELDLDSDGVQAEINGVGLVNAISSISRSETFAIHGTQSWGNRTFYGYSGVDYQHYVIPIGQYYAPGERLYLFFANDADAGQATSVHFKKVTIREGS